MYISQPAQPDGSHILKIGPALPGDMNGDGVVNLSDLPGFVAAIMQATGAPLPLLTADMNADGCADGADIELFVAQIVH